MPSVVFDIASVLVCTAGHMAFPGVPSDTVHWASDTAVPRIIHMKVAANHVE